MKYDFYFRKLYLKVTILMTSLHDLKLCWILYLNLDNRVCSGTLMLRDKIINPNHKLTYSNTSWNMP